MGTRSLTHIYEKDEKTPFCTIYRQFDGYPSGLGADIKEILGSKQLVNGFSDPKNQVNGMGCAAATLIAGLKDGCGNVYIYPANSKGCGEQYTYHLHADQNNFRLVIDAGYKEQKTIFDGNLQDLDPATVEK